MLSYKIHLIRTGATSTGPYKPYVGQTDLPMCEQGLRDLENLRDEYHYPAVDRVFSSPLTRCLQTAEVLYPDIEAETVQGLMDMNLGAFEGKTFAQLRGNSDFVAWLDNSRDNAPPSGEATEDFQRRIVAALEKIFHRMMDQGATSAAAVTHGGVIMSLLAAVGQPRVPLHHWAVRGGAGYTLLMTPQMWMRDRSAEVRGPVPDRPVKDDMETSGVYDSQQ